MKRRTVSALLALVLLASLPVYPVFASQSGISNLKAVPYSATQIKVTWDGGGSVYEVNYSPVDASFHYYDTVYTDSALISVVPETDYAITVNEEGGEESDPVYVRSPRLSTTREYGYKYQKFSLYYVSGGSNLNFWDDDSRTRVERIQGASLAGAGDLRNFHAAVEFTLSSAKSDKELSAVIVLYPPDSADRFTTSEVIYVPAAWTSALWAFSVDNVFQTYLAYNDAFAPGRYALELYFNGWLGGKTTFIVE